MAYGQDRRVVARFKDGRMLKGTTQDFAAHKGEFHVYEGGDETLSATRVRIAELKALFFVKTYVGDKEHKAEQSFEGAQGQGRKIEVTFQDGEVLAGYCMGYNPDKQGFFVVPVDGSGNNNRVFVVNDSVQGVAWA